MTPPINVDRPPNKCRRAEGENLHLICLFSKPYNESPKMYKIIKIIKIISTGGGRFADCRPPAYIEWQNDPPPAAGDCH